MFSEKLRKKNEEKEKRRERRRRKKALQALVNTLYLERLCNTLSATLSTTLIINQRHANYIELYC